MQRRPRARVAAGVALAAVYFAAGKFGLSLALVHASASAIWPPSGIALAACLVLGREVWPAIFAAAFLVNVTTTGNAASSLGIALGNTLEPVAGAWLVERFAAGARAFERPQDVFRFVALAGLASPLLSATLGVTSLCLFGLASWYSFGGVWFTWWLGDAGGAVVVAPVLILWAQDPRIDWDRAHLAEALALLALAIAVGATAFGGWLEPDEAMQALGLLCLPIAIWSGFRFGPRETATLVVVLSALAAWGTHRGAGPFPQSAEPASLLLLQVFLGVIAVSALSLAAVVAERQRTLEALARHAEALARSNAELDEFAHVVSHDLKAPLRGIKSLATWVVEDFASALPAEALDHLAQIRQRARRMSQLIDGVLRYSRIGAVGAAGERLDSRAVLDEVVESLGPLDAALRVEGVFPTIDYDRTQLAQVFQNLIANAIQHRGPTTGEVVVSCRERAGHFEFSVRDDGVGIDEIAQRRIFRMFQAAGPAGETAGVGLAIVKRIVEAHAGEVSVESRPGAGATFRFTIPKPECARPRGSSRRDG